MSTGQEPANLDKAEIKELEESMAKNGVADIQSTDAENAVTLSAFAHLDEKKILRKMDWHIIPVLTILYLFSFLDRGTIGNANIEGLSVDLKLTPDQYNWCLTVFYFTYSAFEIPSNMVLKKLRPSRWLPSIMVAWGIVMTLTGLVHNYTGLLIARLFLGMTEAGLFPGVTYYLTLWYCRSELQFRQALFFSAASTAGAFSGLLAFAIAKMDGVGGLEGWRWIFIIEGIATVIVAVAAFWTVYDSPHNANFLTEEEQEFVLYRLKYQGGMQSATSEDVGARVEEAEEFKWAYVRQAFKDWQVYVFIIVYWGVGCPVFGMSLSLPGIIKDMGYNRSRAQLMTIPIYAAASVIAIIVSLVSDRFGRRSPFVLGCLFLTLVGFSMCVGSANNSVVYAGLVLAACGMFPATPGMITWLANNLGGSYKRSVGMAIQISAGNLGGAMAANFYRRKDSPRYILGHSLSLGFVIGGIIATVTLIIAYRAINKKREEAMLAGRRSQYTEAELSFQGDKAITWRYMY